MLKIILLVIFYIVFPVFVIYICRNWSFANKMGTIVLAYAFGLLFGNIGILPHGSEDYMRYKQGRAAIPASEFNMLADEDKLPGEDRFANQVAIVQDMILTIVIPLALPLLLFSLKNKKMDQACKNRISVNGSCTGICYNRGDSRLLYIP